MTWPVIFGWCGALGVDLHTTALTLRELCWSLKGRSQYDTALNIGLISMLGKAMGGAKDAPAITHPYQELCDG